MLRHAPSTGSMSNLRQYHGKMDTTFSHAIPERRAAVFNKSDYMQTSGLTEHGSVEKV